MSAPNADFAIQFSALRLQARAHGLDPNDDRMRLFLMHVAETEAGLVDRERRAAFSLGPKRPK